MALLEIERLRIEFPTRRGVLLAVDDVSLSIDEGEVLGLVGESGAGKTLTGMAVIDLLEPPGRVARGDIRLGGQRIVGLSSEAMRRIRGARIGAIFQDPLTSLNPLYTIGKQLTETIQTHKDLSLEEARQQAITLLKEVGIPGADQRFNAYPHEFSGGMRQRVVIALAICCNPRLIIADEPTTALDVSVQAQIINLLKRLCRDHGTAILLITHNMGVIAETADRVAVMYSGRIVEISPVEVVKLPRHPIPWVDEIHSGHRRREDELSHIPGPCPGAEIPGMRLSSRCSRVFDRCRRKAGTRKIGKQGVGRLLAHDGIRTADDGS
jgi:peptide/nickel transport system ATP-binding protein